MHPVCKAALFLKRLENCRSACWTKTASLQVYMVAMGNTLDHCCSIRRQETVQTLSLLGSQPKKNSIRFYSCGEPKCKFDGRRLWITILSNLQINSSQALLLLAKAVCVWLYLTGSSSISRRTRADFYRWGPRLSPSRGSSYLHGERVKPGDKNEYIRHFKHEHEKQHHHHHRHI